MKRRTLPRSLCCLLFLASFFSVIAPTLAEEPEGAALDPGEVVGWWTDIPMGGTGQPTGDHYYLFAGGTYLRVHASRCSNLKLGTPDDVLLDSVGRWRQTETGVALEPAHDRFAIGPGCDCRPDIARAPCYLEIEEVAVREATGRIEARFLGVTKDPRTGTEGPTLDLGETRLVRNPHMDVSTAEAFYNTRGVGAKYPTEFLAVHGCRVNPELTPEARVEGGEAKRVVLCDPR